MQKIQQHSHHKGQVNSNVYKDNVYKGNVYKSNVYKSNVYKRLSDNFSIALNSPVIWGYISMLLVLFIWSGFALTIRIIDGSALEIADVALIRFLVPAILLSPWLVSHCKTIQKVKLSDIALILLGGIPFVFLAALGAKSVPVAYVGTILAGTPAFFVAIISYCFLAQTLSKKRLFTLSFILVGILTMIIGESEGMSLDVIIGLCFLFGASFLWSVYIIGLRKIALKPMTITLIISYLSGFIMLLLIGTGMVPSNLGHFSFQQALPFILIQGLGIGVVATICFSYAVSQLGSARSSVLGSLSPAVTALLAVPILGESLSVFVCIGVALTVIGVILSSRC